jgi:hypothetical protein
LLPSNGHAGKVRGAGGGSRGRLPDGRASSRRSRSLRKFTTGPSRSVRDTASGPGGNRKVSCPSPENRRGTGGLLTKANPVAFPGICATGGRARLFRNLRGARRRVKSSSGGRVVPKARVSRQRSQSPVGRSSAEVTITAGDGARRRLRRLCGVCRSRALSFSCAGCSVTGHYLRDDAGHPGCRAPAGISKRWNWGTRSVS